MTRTTAIVMALCLSQFTAHLQADPEKNGNARSENSSPANTPMPSESGSEKIVLTEKPATVQITLDEKLRAEITKAVADPARPQTIRLIVQGVSLPAEALKEKAGIKLFLNKPNATAATSEKDPHFVGAVDFQPTTDRKPQSFLLDLGPAVAELRRTKQIDLHQPLEVTFAAIPSPEQPNAQVKIPIDSVKVTVPKQK